MSHESGQETGNVGLFDAVAIEVGLIVGGALFSLTGVAVALTGPGVVIAFAIAFSIAILGLVPTAMLGSAYPTTGGNYRYPARFVSPALAFLAAWGLAISMFGGGLPLYALTAGQYVDAIVAVEPTLVGLALLTGFFLVNLRGIRPAAQVQSILFVALVAALGAFVVFGVPAVEAANLRPTFTGGPVGLVTAAGVLYFVCLGANFVVDIGGEVRDATLTIPRSFAVSVPLVLGLYALLGFVAVGSVGAEAMAGETLAVAAEAFLPASLRAAFVVGGALFAIATSVNAVFIIAPKYLEVLAADGLIPSVFARRNERFGTNHWGLALVYVLSAAALVSPIPIDQLGSLLGFGGAFLVVPVMLAAIHVVRHRPPDFDSTAFPLSPRLVAGMAVLAIPLNLCLLVLLATTAPRVFAGWLGLLVIGGVYYFARSRYRPQQESPPTLRPEP
ncbi:amino acid transporter [Halovivax ruber XH-70]|uniref:Amino acid transporter n=1 Tax=Halovivax ruber (strain DSM 18193 / JCM 13892 / XH-70) TaxID=797302 RepID=L0I7G2_HALRX|nr:APC family permease [Halovivax ruber]AGB15505.1 amino acid transporter [Halovivax ruber XH-70]